MCMSVSIKKTRKKNNGLVAHLSLLIYCICGTKIYSVRLFFFSPYKSSLVLGVCPEWLARKEILPRLTIFHYEESQNLLHVNVLGRGVGELCLRPYILSWKL